MKAPKSPPTRAGWPRLPPISRATVVGLDGIGRQVALLLAGLAVPRLQLVDPRLVTRRAQCWQGYDHDDIGRPMVHATAQACHQVNPQMEIETVQRRSLRGLDLGDAVFCCSGSAAVPRSLLGWARAETLVLACCTVPGPIIHLALTRVPDTLADWPDGPRRSPSGSSSHPSPAPPIHVAALAAALLVTEFLQFAATGQAVRLIRVDLQDFAITVEESA